MCDVLCFGICCNNQFFIVYNIKKKVIIKCIYNIFIVQLSYKKEGWLYIELIKIINVNGGGDEQR